MRSDRIHWVEEVEARRLMSGAWVGSAVALSPDPASIVMPVKAEPAVKAAIVVKTATITTLAASAGTLMVGQSLTLTATVHSHKTPAPTGTVTFYDGPNLMGSGTLDGSLTAAFAVAAPTLGVHTYKGVYSGDGGFKSSSAIKRVSVVLAPVHAALAVPPGITVGTAVTLGATVTAAAGSSTPGGTVTFLDGAQVLGMAQLDGSGQASLNVTFTRGGAHALHVTYGGDAAHKAARSPVVAARVAGTSVVIPTGDLTYIGQFNEQYSVTYDTNLAPLTGNLSFNVTIKLHRLATVAGQSVYTISSVQSSEPLFGATFAEAPLFGSTAVLPNPPLNLSNQDGQGFDILFPNGASLATINTAGAMHQTTDNRIISNSLDPGIQPHTWTAAVPNDGDYEFAKLGMIPVTFSDGTPGSIAIGYNDIVQSSWAFTLSAL